MAVANETMIYASMREGNMMSIRERNEKKMIACAEFEERIGVKGRAIEIDVEISDNDGHGKSRM